MICKKKFDAAFAPFCSLSKQKGACYYEAFEKINEAYLRRARRKPDPDRELLIDRFLRCKNYF